MDREKLTQRLMATFLGELEDHVRSLNADLLAAEKAGPEAKAEIHQRLFRTVHSLKGAARSVNIAPIERACHRLEDILGAVRDGRRPLDAELVQMLFAAADAIDDAGKRLRAGTPVEAGTLAAMIPAIEAAAGGGALALASAPPPAAAPVPPAPAAGMRDRLVRVPVEKLDAMLASSGELLVARRAAEARTEGVGALHDLLKRWQAEWRGAGRPLARLLRAPEEGEEPGPGGPASLSPRAAAVLAATPDRIVRIEKEIDRLRTAMAGDNRRMEQAALRIDDDVKKLRMVPLAEACEGLDRLVRDLAQAAAKEVDLAVEGGEIEIDRSIAAGLADPLIHLVRNAIHHGIEAPPERRAAGKPERGRVTVSASLRGREVEVAVADDGRGLDLSALREAAGRLGLVVSPDARAAARIVFHPGVTTARQVTEVSGRGMGLDIVKTRIESLHGTVDVAFDPGRGTRFVLSVPLTLTTIRVLFVACGGEVFAIPAAAVARLVAARAADIRSVEGRDAIAIDGEFIPVLSLAEALGVEEGARPRAARTPLVVLDAGERVALAVADLIAGQEVVVKPLGPRLAGIRRYSGATILPTGRVALILNAAEVTRTALSRPPARSLAAALAEPPPASPKRVLVVDDSVTTRTLEQSILEAAGYDVVAATDGAEAWQILQERGADLVVADVDMPRMDGITLTEAIRASRRFRELPVVLLTALESDRDRARGMEAGADAYLTKSAFDQKNLLDAIAQLL